ncbi:MAG TPA: hypothetical protein VGJ91_10600 [Polyangiaceae bacterium]
MSAALRKQLRQLLDSSPSTGEFLEDVQAAIESLYAETEDDCPDGFKALDAAVEAFEANEESDDDEDDEDDDED